MFRTTPETITVLEIGLNHVDGVVGYADITHCTNAEYLDHAARFELFLPSGEVQHLRTLPCCYFSECLSFKPEDLVCAWFIGLLLDSHVITLMKW